MEERDEMGADWSIVPLTDDSSKWKLFDENFPKEKWEISWDDLTMGEVIGQGAFGVVRRAKIQTHKLETKLKFRGEDEIWFKSADRSVDKNEPGMETVAVKMVKGEYSLYLTCFYALCTSSQKRISVNKKENIFVELPSLKQITQNY